MNVVVSSAAGRERVRSVSLHRKQHVVILEEGGVAIRVRFDRQSRKFAIEDLTPQQAASILGDVRKGIAAGM